MGVKIVLEELLKAARRVPKVNKSIPFIQAAILLCSIYEVGNTTLSRYKQRKGINNNNEDTTVSKYRGNKFYSGPEEGCEDVSEVLK
jgi:hypothetical protein